MLSALLCLLLPALLGAGACSQTGKAEKETQAAPAPVRVSFAQVQERDLDREIPTTGSLVAEETVTASSEVSGIVRELKADVGDFVRRGDVLVRLDDREYRLRVERQQAALEEALARVGASSASKLPTPEETPGVRQAAALLQDAERRLGRAAELIERGALSRSDYDEAKTARDVARARHETAQQEARNRLASVRSFQAALALAQKDLADTLIRAPLDAYVEKRHVSVGEYVRENTPLFELVQSQKLKLVAEVPEREAAVVKVGMRVLLAVDAFPGEQFEARITRISPSVNERSRTFRFEARVLPSRGGHVLKPGFFARCRILAGRRRTLLVPLESLYTLAGVKKIFVRRGDRVEARLVETGVEMGDTIEIVRGIQAGEEVATTNLHDLTDGQPVRFGTQE